MTLSWKLLHRQRRSHMWTRSRKAAIFSHTFKWWVKVKNCSVVIESKLEFFLGKHGHHVLWTKKWMNIQLLISSSKHSIPDGMRVNYKKMLLSPKQDPAPTFLRSGFKLCWFVNNIYEIFTSLHSVYIYILHFALTLVELGM